MNSLLKFIFPGPEKMTECLRARATLSEDPDWVPRTMRTSHELMTSLAPVSKEPVPSSGLPRHEYTHVVHIHTHRQRLTHIRQYN